MTSVVKITCEWDIGLEDNLYTSMEVAEEYARQALADCDIEESLEELDEEGLISFEWVDIISE